MRFNKGDLVKSLYSDMIGVVAEIECGTTCRVLWLNSDDYKGLDTRYDKEIILFVRKNNEHR